MSGKNVIIVIPAYRPDEILIRLIEKLMDQTILVIDDGSGEAYSEIFIKAEKLGAMILGYRENKGKGCALKYAFQWIYEQKLGVRWIVTADADGQHAVADIWKMISGLNSNSDIVLKIGTRKFWGYVPLRSRLGNCMSSWLFKKITGEALSDTQSGLRAYSASYLPFFIQIPGERYEYELNSLLFCAREKLRMEQIFINTIYEKNNTSSHFCTVTDTLRICQSVVKYILFPNL